jgi:hypothetical protein
LSNIICQRCAHSIIVEVHFLSEDSFAILDSRGEFSKIKPFLHLQIHHIMVMTVSMDHGCARFLLIPLTARWGLAECVSVIPTISQHLLAKLQRRKRWFQVSSTYRMQLSQVYESRFICLLLSTFFVFSVPCRMSQKNNFCLGWHFVFPIMAKVCRTSRVLWISL